MSHYNERASRYFSWKKVLAICLIKYRRDLNFSQNELSFKAQVSSSVISLIERQNYNPTAQTLIKISIALGVSIEELFGGAPEYGERPEALPDELFPASHFMHREYHQLLGK